MRKHGTHILLVIALVAACGWTAAAGGGLAASVVVTELVVAPNGRLPQLAGGYLLEAPGYATSPAEAKICLLNVAARSWRELNPWPEEPTAELVVKGVQPLKDGRIVVGLRAVSWANERAEVVAVFDKEGRRQSWFRTNPYAWDTFAVDEDQSLWMFGACPDYLAHECGMDDPLVRHYSLDGKLLDGFLPFRSFPEGALHVPERKVGSDWVGLSRAAVGIYVAATAEWIELDRKGRILARQKMELPSDSHGFRFARSRSGRLVVGGSGMAALLEWNPQTATFEPRPDFSGYLLGAEDGKLVLATFVVGKETTLHYHEFE